MRKAKPNTKLPVPTAEPAYKLAVLNRLTDICAQAQAISAQIEGNLPDVPRADDRTLLLHLKVNADRLVRELRGKCSPERWEEIMDGIGYMHSLQHALAQMDSERKILSLRVLALISDGLPEITEVKRIVDDVEAKYLKKENPNP